MTDEQIKEIIFKLLGRIAPEADFDALLTDENMRKALDIDSFDFLNLFIGLNDELGVEIPESDYGRLDTLTNIIAYLSERLD